MCGHRKETSAYLHHADTQTVDQISGTDDSKDDNFRTKSEIAGSNGLSQLHLSTKTEKKRTGVKSIKRDEAASQAKPRKTHDGTYI